MNKVETIKMNDGWEIPVMGLGTYIRGMRTKRVLLASKWTVEMAITLGYRHIDTAKLYENEQEVGEAIRGKIADGTITRDEIFVTTKLWNDEHEEEKVVPALKRSLEKLGLDYVDLFLIHWPISINEDGQFSDVDYVDTWRAMEQCQRLGLTRSIGVSNFNTHQLERIIESGSIVPALNQVEVNPNLTQKPLLQYCREKGIIVGAFCPFGLMPESKTSQDAPPPRPDDPQLTTMAHKYNKTTMQIVLRYLVDCGLAVTPKTVTPERLLENMDIFDFHLDSSEVAIIDAFNIDRRVINVPWLRDHKHFPF